MSHPLRCHKQKCCVLFFQYSFHLLCVSCFSSVSLHFYLSLPFLTTHSHFVLPLYSSSFSFLLGFILLFRLFCILLIHVYTFLVIHYFSSSLLFIFLSDSLSSLLPSFPLLVIYFLTCRPVSEEIQLHSCYCPRYWEYLQMANRPHPYEGSQFEIFSILLLLSVS